MSSMCLSTPIFLFGGKKEASTQNVVYGFLFFCLFVTDKMQHRQEKEE